MQDFKKLEVWKKSHALVLDVYARTANFAGPIASLSAQRVRVGEIADR
jgi:hypothetical protein